MNNGETIFVTKTYVYVRRRRDEWWVGIMVTNLNISPSSLALF